MEIKLEPSLKFMAKRGPECTVKELGGNIFIIRPTSKETRLWGDIVSLYVRFKVTLTTKLKYKIYFTSFFLF